MKKNISINISGIIFHIEEDGYDKLKEYLDTIHRYFATYDDSSEIIADIENRIAEIFLGKLKEGKQVITDEDVEALKSTMGGIKDFKEVEMEEEPEEEKGEEAYSGGSAESYSPQSKKLCRDERRKILGGVLSGIAHYFSVDPLWIRLIFIVLFFGVWFVPSMFVLLSIAYIVLWIVVPGSYELEEEKKIKKMYRNPDDKVLGGVASGVAMYFGIDVVIVRLLFVVLLFFGGTGLILYIILWIILPEARTITDKMEMQGEPVTLKNIESNIKRSFRVDSDEEESIWVKILLFPFRLIAALINFLSKALGPIAAFLVEAIRVIFGLALVLIAIAMTLGLLIAAGIGFGLFTGGFFVEYVDFPIHLVSNEISAVPLIAGFFAGLIPQIFLLILGISIITKELLLNARVGWSLFAVWIISLVIMAFTIPPMVGNYARDGVYEEVDTFDMPYETVLIDLKYIGLEDYEVTRLRLRGHEDSVFRLEKRFEAVGKTRLDAIENAKMVNYNYVLEDSMIVFNSNIEFKEGARFRGQSLDMTLYIPHHRKFRMDYDLRHIIRNTIYYYGFREYQMENNTWMFTQDGLECLTCEEEDNSGEEKKDFENTTGSETRSFDLSGFGSIDISSIFNAEVVQGSDWEVILNGRSEDLDDVVVRMINDDLEVDFTRDISRWDTDREKVKVYIKMPDLEGVELSGAARAVISGFEQNLLSIDMSGAASAEMDFRVDDMDVDMNGLSNLTLTGRGNRLKANIAGASNLEAFDYMVENAEVEVSGASKVKVYVSDLLEIDASGGSEVRYKGDPRVRSERYSGSRIIKE